VGDVLGPVSLRFRLDCEREADIARRDRDVIDVPAALPGNGVPQPPLLAPQRLERAPDLPLGACAHPAARGEPAPVAGVRGQHGRRDQQRSGDRGSADAPRQHGQQAGGKRGRRRRGGAAQTPVLLLARIAGHAHLMRY
jgi:hypothetical protein